MKVYIKVIMKMALEK